MKHLPFDRKASKQKIETAGVNKNTEKAQRLAEKHFLDFTKEKLGDKHEDIFAEASILEDILIQFFKREHRIALLYIYIFSRTVIRYQKKFESSYSKIF